MDKDRILNKLKAIQARALTAAAYVLLEHVKPFVPIDTSNLKNSGKIVTIDDGVGISFGEGIEYAAYQYGEGAVETPLYARYHHIKNGVMARMLELLHGEEKADVAGEINQDRYSAAYQQAMAEGKLTRLPRGAQWFKVVLNDKDVQHSAWMAYANALRAA